MGRQAEIVAGHTHALERVEALRAAGRVSVTMERLGGDQDYRRLGAAGSSYLLRYWEEEQA